MNLSQETKAPTDHSPSRGLEANGSPPPGSFLAAASANGQSRALPTRAIRRRRWLFYAVGFTGLIAIAAAIALFVYYRPAAARPDVLLHTVKRESLDVTVSEKGTLESANNIDVVCKVRAGSKGFASTINWVIDDGSKVKKDQILMVLDDSALQDQRRNQLISVDQALSAKVTAEKSYEIAVKEGARAVAEAENNLALAQITLDQYIGLSFDQTRAALGSLAGGPATLGEDGAYRQKFDDLTGKVRLSESDVEQNRERAAWADRMVKQKYMSPAQAQAERSRLESSLENFRSLQSQRSILLNYERKMNLTDYRSKMENARLLLEQKVLEGDAKRVQADIERRTKINIWNNESEKLKELEDQIRECRIHSPQDGMVVYFKNEGNRFGNNPQNLIEQGAQVKEGQKLLRIPNLERMQVNTKVHEVMVSRIKGDVRVATNFLDKLQVGMLANPDPFSRLVSQKEDVMQLIRDNEKYRHKEYETVSKGQDATIKVDAMSTVKLKGRVKSVARVASQADAFMADVKLYPTIVLIEDQVEGLNPDMSAEVTIHIRGIKDVLTIPLQAVVGGSELGLTRKVFVKTATGYDEKDVTLGIYNDKVIEVREGLREGDEVVINPKVLMGDAKQKTRDGAAPAGDGKSGDGKANPNAPAGALPGEKGGFDPAKKKKGGGGPGGPGGMPPQG